MAEQRPASPVFPGGLQGARTQGLSAHLAGPGVLEQTPVLRVPMSNPNEGKFNFVCMIVLEITERYPV